MTVKRWFWWAVAVQVAVLLLMIASHGYTLATGRAVTLKTVPTDPWSPWSGRYVALSYDISHLVQGDLPMEGGPFRWHQTVWVTLEKGDPYWKAVAVSSRRRTVNPDQVALRATVTGAWQSYGESGPQDSWEYNLHYGIEQFYIPEGEATLERRGLEFTVEAVVDSFGRAALHRVFLDGKEIRWR